MRRGNLERRRQKTEEETGRDKKKKKKYVRETTAITGSDRIKHQKGLPQINIHKSGSSTHLGKDCQEAL